MALVACGLENALAAEGDSTAGTNHLLSDFKSPSSFYLIRAWSNKVQFVDGQARLRAVDPSGGMIRNATCDLSPYSNLAPALILRTTPTNTASQILLTVADADGRNATWFFPLPEPSINFGPVFANGHATISHPNWIEKYEGKLETNVGPLDLTKIRSLKVQGTWAKGILDLDLDSVVLLSASAKPPVGDTTHPGGAANAPTDENQRLARERQQRIQAYSYYRGDGTPEVSHIWLAAPGILALTIDVQRTVRSTMAKYAPLPGDEKKVEQKPDGRTTVTLVRQGQPVGTLRGTNLDCLFTYERLEGSPLLEFLAEMPENYSVQSIDDPDYTNAVRPVAVYRKCLPSDVVLPGGLYPTRHQIYLRLPSAIQAGKHYSIKVSGVNVRPTDRSRVKGITSTIYDFAADLPNVRSDSVHVNQIGYRPDDPVKRAFLSVWLGTGGACEFPDKLGFSLIEQDSNAVVYSGKIERALAANDTEQLGTGPRKNFSGTAVYRMDFSAFQQPGTYRVYVEGVGCSYPFQISPSAWKQAFLTQMKGLYNQRSGVELGPPYTDFKKPRDFHPDDGAVATRSTFDVLSQAGGQFAYAEMAKDDTKEAVTNAWGGYHDAGDWNPRRVTHMYTTLAQLELCELYPGYFNTLKLNIPQTDGVPDMLTEALFEIDCFRRLQWPDGAVPYGIETNGDPLSGDVSWLSTMHCYVLAPNIRDSWLYAATAARAAKLLKPFKPELAKTYQESAVRAYQWAEKELAKKRAAGDTLERKTYWDAFDARNLSSLVLYDLTGEPEYHDVFLQDTCLNRPGAEIAVWGMNIQCDAVFLYARMDAAKTDARLREAARAGVISLAERSLQYAAGNAFNLTQREFGHPLAVGFFSTAGGSELVRAYYLTGNGKYLKGAVQSCQFQSGCNPNNLVYTTGLGANPVKNPLQLDARSSGQRPPVGLTVFGNANYFEGGNSFWGLNIWTINHPEFVWPDAYHWPLTEAYFDVWMLPSANEFVIDTWAPNVLVWGCLAARPSLSIKLSVNL